MQLLVFDECPLAPGARTVLERALERVGRARDDYTEVNLLDPATPKELASWGSPTILVDGRDVTGQSRGDAAGCRIYDTASQLPDLEQLIDALS